MTAGRSEGDSWGTRLGRLDRPEIVVGGLITGGWAAAAALGLLGLAPAALGGAAVAVAVAAWLHLAAVDSGHHSLAWMSTGLTVLCIVLTLARQEAGPLVFAAAGVSALIHGELIRLSYTRRRRAVVDRGVVRGAAAGVTAAAALALAGVWLAVTVSGGTGRSWVWMPATVAVLVAATMVLTVAPVRRAPAPSRDRWRPGDRIPPPPAGAAGPPATAGSIEGPDLLAPDQVPPRPVGDSRAGR